MHNIGLFMKINNGVSSFKYDELNEFNIFKISKKEITKEDVIELKNRILRRNSSFARNPFPIVVFLGEIEFEDKLTILLLECLCYYLIKEIKKKVYINCAFQKNILTEEALLSPINYLRNDTYSIEKFIKYFHYDVNKNHFRQFLSYEKIIGSDYLSVLYGDFVSFQKNLDVDDEAAEETASVMVELIGNACEHTETDCLIDFDIAQNYSKKDDNGNLVGDYYAINISIINFSQKLFYDDIYRKINLLVDEGTAQGRYKVLVQAFKNHKRFFDVDYDANRFCIIAAFQDKISGRMSNSATGGKGLKKLINSLQKKSDASICYMQTGSVQFFFADKYLDYDVDDWIGFNDNNNFLNSPPNKMLFRKNSFYIPGTAYNLTFVYEREEL